MNVLIRCFLAIAFLIFCSVFSHSQGVNIGANTPADSSATLEVSDTTGGFLLPRLTTAQRNAITNPANGLQIYNKDTDCLEMYFPSGWKAVSCNCNAFPNATFSVPNAYDSIPVTISSPTPNMTYNWTFQNGNPSTSNTQSTQVTWDTAGTFAITLTVTDSAGCSASYTDSIIVDTCQPFTMTFTNCGATGRFGPTQAQANATYGNGVVSISGGIQNWVVTQSGNYTIGVAGAQGGNGPSGNNGGSGVIVKGEFQLVQGQTIRIVVGQMGVTKPTDNGTNYGGGGGGGTYVWDSISTTEPLISAGGGGGGYNSGNSSNNKGGTGLTITSGGNASTSGGSGGNNGLGGSGSGSYAGAGGAGWKGNGGNTSNNQQQGGRMKFSFTGGENYYYAGNNYGVDGGFGGGGAAMHGGGGGGGYSGGGGGSNSSSAGGGSGSYIASSATNVATSDGQYNNSNTFNSSPIQNLNSYNNGHGYVTITRVCN